MTIEELWEEVFDLQKWADTLREREQPGTDELQREAVEKLTGALVLLHLGARQSW